LADWTLTVPPRASRRLQRAVSPRIFVLSENLSLNSIPCRSTAKYRGCLVPAEMHPAGSSQQRLPSRCSRRSTKLAGIPWVARAWPSGCSTRPAPHRHAAWPILPERPPARRRRPAVVRNRRRYDVTLLPAVSRLLSLAICSLSGAVCVNVSQCTALAAPVAGLPVHGRRVLVCPRRPPPTSRYVYFTSLARM
jgi:hypothetical protein